MSCHYKNCILMVILILCCRKQLYHTVLQFAACPFDHLKLYCPHQVDMEKSAISPSSMSSIGIVRWRNVLYVPIFMTK